MNLKATALLVIIGFLCLIPELGLSQNKISGKVQGQDNTPIPFANVLLLQPGDSSLVKGTISEETGAFNIEDIERGDYLGLIRVLGFESHYFPLNLEETNPSIDIGTVVLQEDVTTLEEIEIVGEKPMFEQKADKMVVNVEEIVTAQGSTVLDVLSRSPGVIVNRQNYTISVAGKDGIQLMIDGKVTRLPPEGIGQMLEGMNAANIEKIEVITNPPASFEAEGNAGFINIVTKQGIDSGTNGSFSLQSGYGRDFRYGGTFNINHRSKKFFIYLDINHVQNRLDESILLTREMESESGERSVGTTSRRYTDFGLTNANFGIDYFAGKNTVIGFNFTGLRRDWDMDAENDISNENTSYPDMYMFNSELNLQKYGAFNLNFQQGIGDNQSIKADFTYINNSLSNPTSYDHIYYGEVEGDSVLHREVSKETPIEIFVPALDYSIQLSPAVSLNAGGKIVSTDLTNTVVVNEEFADSSRVNPKFSFDLGLDDNIYQGYVEVNSTIGEKITLNGGLRYEHTDTHLFSPDSGTIIKRDYGTWVPSVAFSYRANDNNSFGISVGRRITRPSFWDLAPFFIFVDPLTFVTGNVGIQAAISDNYSANYQYKSYFISATYTFTDNLIARWQPTVDSETGESLTTAYNFDKQHNFSLALSVPITVTKWWDMQNNFTYNYQKLDTEFENTQLLLDWNFYTIRTISFLKLPKKFTLELSYNYNSQSAWGFSVVESNNNFNVGIQKEFGENGGTLSLNLFDIFNKAKWIMNSQIPELDINSRFKYDFDSRYFMLTYRKTFGSSKVKGKRERKGLDSDVRNRISN